MQLWLRLYSYTFETPDGPVLVVAAVEWYRMITALGYIAAAWAVVLGLVLWGVVQRERVQVLREDGPS